MQKSRVLGSASELTKSQAREAVAEIVKSVKQDSNPRLFGGFVEGPYFGFYTRKWKASTVGTNRDRIRNHLVEAFRERDMASLNRSELQNLLDEKSKTYSFSVVDHLKWDLNQILEMAVSEGILKKNTARLLFTPKEAKRPVYKVLSIQQVGAVLQALETRERPDCEACDPRRYAPGEIFALTWGRVAEASAEVTQRVYRGKIDTPKTHHSVREAALTEGLLADLVEWGDQPGLKAAAYVFPSEVGTPLSKDNVWRRNMQPALEKVGLAWANFQVMRPTHSTIMKTMKADPKAVADQLGHSVDANQNVYTQTPVETRAVLVNDLERLIAGKPERCALAVQKEAVKNPTPK